MRVDKYHRLQRRKKLLEGLIQATMSEAVKIGKMRLPNWPYEVALQYKRPNL